MSIFAKDTAEAPLPVSPYGKDLIEKEIGHLKKPQSTRQARDERSTMAMFVVFVAVCGLAGLYVLDPCLFAWHKGDATRAYLYLHNYDTEKNALALAHCGILDEEEINTLNHRTGSFQDYFANLQEAQKTATSIEQYMNGVRDLHEGRFDNLDTLSKVRFLLFFHFGLTTPIDWIFLDPTV